MIVMMLIIACGVGLLFLLLTAIVIFVFTQASQRDMVSTAREGWIQRRSEKDEQNW